MCILALLNAVFYLCGDYGPKQACCQLVRDVKKLRTNK